MKIIANQDGIGTSKFDLYLYKVLYLLRKSKWLEKQIVQIAKDLEAIKNRKVF